MVIDTLLTAIIISATIHPIFVVSLKEVHLKVSVGLIPSKSFSTLQFSFGNTTPPSTWIAYLTANYSSQNDGRGSDNCYDSYPKPSKIGRRLPSLDFGVFSAECPLSWPTAGGRTSLKESRRMGIAKRNLLQNRNWIHNVTHYFLVLVVTLNFMYIMYLFI